MAGREKLLHGMFATKKVSNQTSSKLHRHRKKLKYGKCMETAKEAKSLDSLVEYRECLETGKTTKFLEYGENLKVLLTDGQTNSVIFSLSDTPGRS